MPRRCADPKADGMVGGTGAIANGCLNFLKPLGRAKNPGPTVGPAARRSSSECAALACQDPRPHNQPARRRGYAKNLAVLVVRHPGRGGGEILRLHLQKFEDRKDCALWRSRAGAE